MSESQNRSRRSFLKTASTVAAAPYVITSAALGNADQPPASDRVTLGGIGFGSQGQSDQKNFLAQADVQYLGVSDVRKGAVNGAKKRIDERYGNSDCKTYNDFRELLARDDIDAIHIATPDHWHAIMVIEACRRGKDVFCQKPETRTLREGPLMIDAARRYSRVVSGGSQRVWEDYHKIVDPAWAGELGTIKSINVNVGPLPQQCNLPAEKQPDDIDWDLWLGPAPWAPYNGARCSGNYSTAGNSWRSYVDYSGGGLTDWGAHHFGGATFAIDVREEQPVECVFHNDNGAKWLTFRYANGKLLHHNKPNTENLVIEGTPDEKLPGKPVPGYKGVGGIHGDFIHCVKSRETPFRDIDLAVNSSALSHMAGIAYNVERTLKWDRAAQQFTGDEEANRYLDRARREPWQL